MEDLREKLVELVSAVLNCLPWGEISSHTAEDIVDRLIEYGVTFAEDNNVPSKWISVKDRLPEEDKKILLLCKNGAMFVGVLGRYYGGTESRFKICTALASTKLLNKGRVTHWMPLPEPPKGG